MYECAVFSVVPDCFKGGRTGIINIVAQTWSYNFGKTAVYGFIGDILAYLYFEKHYETDTFLQDVRTIIKQGVY